MAPSASQRIPVSIHALLAESDTSWCWPRPTAHCFNPRPPCGERHQLVLAPANCSLFQSTPSLRRATVAANLSGSDGGVSIHALLAESDTARFPRRSREPGFNPRPPCGERHGTLPSTLTRAGFQSTPSLRRATAPTVHVVNQSCKRGFAPTSRRRYITYRLLFIILGCQSAFSNVLQESPTSRQFDVSLGLAQRPCQTALK